MSFWTQPPYLPSPTPAVPQLPAPFSSPPPLPASYSPGGGGGILDLLLGANNPLSQFVDSRHNTFSALGAGLAQGPDFASGLSKAAQLVPQGRAADQEAMAKNRTIEMIRNDPKYSFLADAITPGSDIGPVVNTYMQAKAADRVAATDLARSQSFAKGLGDPNGDNSDIIAALNAGDIKVADAFKTLTERKSAALKPPSTSSEFVNGAEVKTQWDPSTRTWVPMGGPKSTAATPPSGYQWADPGNTTLRPIPGGPSDVNSLGGPSVASANGTPLQPVALGADGLPDPQQQQQFLASLPPATASLVKQVIAYQVDPVRSTSVRGDQRQQLITLAGMVDPTYDQTQFNARAQARKAYSTGQQGQTITSANTVIGHLSNLHSDIEKLGNTGFAPWNAVANATKGAFSSPDLAKFNTDRQAVASELAKFFKGTGSTDLTTTQEWLARLDPNAGPEALKTTIEDIVGNLMKSKLDEMRSQYSSVMGKPTDFKFISPETTATLRSLGIDPGQLDPSAAGGAAGAPQPGEVTATNPATKQRVVFRGGQWVPL